MTDQKAYQATPNATLEQRVMSPHMPKSEAEHWARREIERLRAEVERLEREWENERMRLAACGVVANANTQETSKAARTMHSNYFCQSVFDVCAAVDREMAERAKVSVLRAAAIKMSEAWENNTDEAFDAIEDLRRVLVRTGNTS